MKKLILGLMLSTAMIASADTASPVVSYTSLLNGWNVQVPTNTAVTLGSTNVLFTNPQGQVLYSLTNNTINGVLATNTGGVDAFQYGRLSPDANGDINANATLVVYIGNTNWIPVVTTNLAGQYFATNWVLSSQQFPQWMYPATTNYYQGYSNNCTNVLSVILYKTAKLRPLDSPSNPLNITETVGSITNTFTATGITPLCVFTNLPTGFIQGGYNFTVSLQGSTLVNASPTLLVNAIGIIQPKP